MHRFTYLPPPPGLPLLYLRTSRSDGGFGTFARSVVTLFGIVTTLQVQFIDTHTLAQNFHRPSQWTAVGCSLRGEKATCEARDAGHYYTIHHIIMMPSTGQWDRSLRSGWLMPHKAQQPHRPPLPPLPPTSLPNLTPWPPRDRPNMLCSVRVPVLHIRP